jgi:type I restriction enzyme, S subunit
MIEGLKPYPEYRESEIPWAPVLPSTWQTERAKRLFTKMQRPVRPEDDVVTCFRDGRVTLRKNRRLRGFTEATAFSGYQGIRQGDLVIHGMDAFAGAIGVSDSDGKGTPVYNVCKPNPGIVASYYAHTVREMSRAQWILALARGIRERSTDFRYETFGNQFVPLPPPDEQAAIVQFLDHANRKIDGFIRAKRKLIGLLNEQKQAIIHRAVTRGLNPKAPLKPSGIPWLGDIPKHWEVVRSRRLFTVRTELARPDDVQLSATQSYGVIPQADYEAKIGRRVVKISMHLEKRRHVEKDDFVISMRSFQGGIERSWASGAIRSSYVVMKPDPSVDVVFFSYVLKSPGYIRALQATGDFIRDGQDLTYGNFRMVDLPLMPLPEQKQIAAHIDSATKAIETSHSRTEREITLMQEYRTRLTADVVTGKLDVREAAARLPDLPADVSAPDPLADEETEEADTEEAEI